MTRGLLPLLPAVLLAVPSAPTRGAEGGGGVTSKVVLRTATTASGAPVTYPSGAPGRVTAATIEIAPGAETGWHRHPVPVYAWVVGGTLTVDYEGGKSVVVKSGEPLVEAVGTVHDGRNEGKEPVRLLVFYTGLEGTPDAVSVAPPRGPMTREVPPSR